MPGDWSLQLLGWLAGTRDGSVLGSVTFALPTVPYTLLEFSVCPDMEKVGKSYFRPMCSAEISRKHIHFLLLLVLWLLTVSANIRTPGFNKAVGQFDDTM